MSSLEAALAAYTRLTALALALSLTEPLLWAPSSISSALAVRRAAIAARACLAAEAAALSSLAATLAACARLAALAVALSPLEPSS